MSEVMGKGQLAVILSQLQGFSELKVRDEQYLTDSEIAATVLNEASIRGDLAGNTIADLGAGTGILGLGTWLMGANKVILVEKDPKAVEVSKSNAEMLKSEFSAPGSIEFCENPINLFNQKVDVVIQNPPFGTRKEHADKEFLEKAMQVGKVVYTFHKTSTANFVEKFADSNSFVVTHRWDFDFPLKNTYAHHSTRIKRVEVSCWRLEKQ